MLAQRTASQRRAAHVGELLTDLAARYGPRVAVGGKRGAGLIHERLHPLPRAVEHVCDLLVVERTELGEDERRPLVVWQPTEIADDLAQVLAPLDFGCQPLRRRLDNVDVCVVAS